MRFLLIPENNSLSHIAKCLSVMDILRSNGHQVHIAVAAKHSGFLNQLGIGHHVLSDIQETDSGGFPSFKWFSNIEVIESCIHEEVTLINKVKPDRVLGVFRFTLYASAKITKVPYDTLICGCMIPDSKEVLGFSEHDQGIEIQQEFIANFFQFAGKKVSQSLAKFGLGKIDDIRTALKGERTFLWDFPEFMPLPKQSNLIHVGPISLHSYWPYDPLNLDSILDSKYPIAVVSFGTCVTDNATVLRIIKLLLDLDFMVLVAAGGQQEMFAIQYSDPRLVMMKYAPLHKIFPYTSLLVTHGGQMTVFEALRNGIPVVVMPLQPEQAHNGVCLERIGCGCRLIPSTLFTGIPDDYINAFNQIPDDAIKTKISNLVTSNKVKENLAGIKKVLERYEGEKTVAKLLEVN
jgi:UDP:flavonoid glycosyltransferase YjiC (YdhE family)